MNPEIFEKAQIIMQNRRRTAVLENDRRTDEINEKIPEIRLINDTIFNTGRELIKIIGAGGNDIKQRIESLRQNNLDAQAMSRKLLVENGYPSDYLDIKYNCNICNDTGYDGPVICECFNKLCGKLEADEINKHSNLELSSFDTFSLKYYTGDDYASMKRILEYSINYAENFTPHSISIFIHGKTGLGKTHLSLAIANKVLEKGYSVIYDSAINILREIERENFSYERTSYMTDLVMNTDLLILDDLGTETRTQFYTSMIYNIINTRLNHRKPVIISTNLDHNEMLNKYDERIMSRITTQYANLMFTGKDIRWQKKNEKKSI